MIAAKAFSGSGNVDLLNTAGLQTGNEKPIVLCVIKIGWTRKLEMPGMPFNQAFPLPAELSLRASAHGLQAG